MDRCPALSGLAAGAQFPGCHEPERPAVHAIHLHPHRGAAAVDLRPVVPHPAHQPSQGVPSTGPGQGGVPRAAGTVLRAAGFQPGPGRPLDGTDGTLARLVRAVHPPAGRRHLGHHALGTAGTGLCAVVAAALATGAAASAGGGGVPGPLQRLRTVFRRLPLFRDYHGAPREWAARHAHGRSARRPVR